MNAHITDVDLTDEMENRLSLIQALGQGIASMETQGSDNTKFASRLGYEVMGEAGTLLDIFRDWKKSMGTKSSK